MLSDVVLEEFSRNSPLTPHLVALAWPSLSTESKLQIIAAGQRDYSPSTPAWLADLAMDDEAAIVQYAALRHTYLKTRSAGEANPLFAAFAATESEIAQHEKAHSLQNFLVQAAVLDVGSFPDKEVLIGLSQTERLVVTRNKSNLDLGVFVEWLTGAIAAGVSDEDLAECAGEFFARPDTQNAMKVDKFDFHSGEAAYFAGKALEDAWALIKTAGPRLQNRMYWSLPTALGMTTMKPEVLATMPDRLLGFMVTDSNPGAEVAAVQALIKESPGKFPSEVVEKMERTARNEDGFPHYSKEEIADMRRLSAVDPARQTLEVVMELKAQIKALKEQLEDVKEAASTKRGFFS